ncbi:MAG: PaaI family thioesterase [Pseudomonadota bacterium]
MTTTLSSQRREFLKQDFERGFIRYCQFSAFHMDRGVFRSRVDIQDHHRQQDNFIHAGVMATMADHTAGYAAFTTVTDKYQILTIEFKINFLKPAMGNALECHSQVLRDGRQIIIAESEVYDIRDTGRVMAAKATVTLMAVPREKLQR